MERSLRFTHRHEDDVQAIKKAINVYGYNCDLEDAANIWEDYSGSMAAGWISVPNEVNQIWELISETVKDLCYEG